MEKFRSREQYYLDKFKLEFNILKYAYSTLGFNYTEKKIKKECLQ